MCCYLFIYLFPLNSTNSFFFEEDEGDFIFNEDEVFQGLTQNNGWNRSTAESIRETRNVTSTDPSQFQDAMEDDSSEVDDDTSTMQQD